MNFAIIDKQVVEHKSPSTRFIVRVWFAMTIIIMFCIILPKHSRAADLGLLSIGFRAQVGEKSTVLGKEQPESFEENDIVASIQLPWEGQSLSDWELHTVLLASAGVLRGANTTALVASAIPALAFGRLDKRFTVELGVGLALLSKHRFAQQEYGGPLQFALSFGVGVPLYRRVGVGYRFMHYSDAGLYGSDTIGADFHMVELIYRY